MNKLFESYDVSSNEELYIKVESGLLPDLAIRIESEKRREPIMAKPVRTPSDAIELAISFGLDSGKPYIVSLDNRGEVQKFVPIEEGLTLKGYAEAIRGLPVHYAYILSTEEERFDSKVQYFEENLRSVLVEYILTATYDAGCNWYLHYGDESGFLQYYPLKNNPYNEVEREKVSKNMLGKEAGVSPDGYIDFLKYYAEKKLIGKNQFSDLKEVESLLKVGFGNSDREYFVTLAYDIQDRIVDVSVNEMGDNLTAYALRRAEARFPATSIRSLLSKEEVKGVSCFLTHSTKSSKPRDTERVIAKQVSHIISSVDADLGSFGIASVCGVNYLIEPGGSTDVLSPNAKTKEEERVMPSFIDRDR